MAACMPGIPLDQAAQSVVPVAVTVGDKIGGIRQWAAGRRLSAYRAGVYSRSEAGSDGRIRRVVREPEGELCGHENTEGSGPMMATYSPRVGTALAGYAVSDPLLPTPHREAAAGESGEGDHAGGGFGDGGKNRLPDQGTGGTAVVSEDHVGRMRS